MNLEFADHILECYLGEKEEKPQQLRSKASTSAQGADDLSSRPICIVLYGGSGTGKSTVASILERYGGCILSCDDSANQVLAHGHPSGAYEKIRDAVGADKVLHQPTSSQHRQHPEIDREKLRELIVADPAIRKTVNQITFDAINQVVEEKYKAHCAVMTKEGKRRPRRGGRHALSDISWSTDAAEGYSFFVVDGEGVRVLSSDVVYPTEVWILDCPDGVRVERLMNRLLLASPGGGSSSSTGGKIEGATPDAIAKARHVAEQYIALDGAATPASKKLDSIDRARLLSQLGVATRIIPNGVGVTPDDLEEEVLPYIKSLLSASPESLNRLTRVENAFKEVDEAVKAMLDGRHGLSSREARDFKFRQHSDATLRHVRKVRGSVSQILSRVKVVDARATAHAQSNSGDSSAPPPLQGSFPKDFPLHDIMGHVSTFLTPQDLVPLAAVSHHLAGVIASDDVWVSFAQRLFLHEYSNVVKKNRSTVTAGTANVCYFTPCGWLQTTAEALRRAETETDLWSWLLLNRASSHERFFSKFTYAIDMRIEHMQLDYFNSLLKPQTAKPSSEANAVDDNNSSSDDENEGRARATVPQKQLPEKEKILRPFPEHQKALALSSQKYRENFQFASLIDTHRLVTSTSDTSGASMLMEPLSVAERKCQDTQWQKGIDIVRSGFAPFAVSVCDNFARHRRTADPRMDFSQCFVDAAVRVEGKRDVVAAAVYRLRPGFRFDSEQPHRPLLEVIFLGVHGELREKKAASALVDHILRVARAFGCAMMYVETGPPVTERFWESQGFVRLPRSGGSSEVGHNTTQDEEEEEEDDFDSGDTEETISAARKEKADAKGKAAKERFLDAQVDVLDRLFFDRFCWRFNDTQIHLKPLSYDE